MSYFETLSESDELLMEDPMCDGILGTAALPRNQEKCTAKNSTLLNHFTVKKQSDDKSHTTDCNSHSNNEELHEPVMSQEEIDHLLNEDDFDSWFDDIT